MVRDARTGGFAGRGASGLTPAANEEAGYRPRRLPLSTLFRRNEATPEPAAETAKPDAQDMPSSPRANAAIRASAADAQTDAAENADRQ